MKLYAFADEASTTIDGQIAAMKRNGLNGLEIRGVDGCSISDISIEKAQEVRKKLDDADLEVWSVGSPIGKIDILAGDFEAHMQKFRHTLQLAQILRAKNIRLFSFYIPEGHVPERYCEEIVKRLRLFVSEAEGTGIDLCHENEKRIYGDNAKRCLELYQAVPGLKGIFDPANFVQCGQDTVEAWQLLHPHIKYLHIKDAIPDGTVVPAGRGVGNVPYILKSFKEQGGSHLTVEPHLTVFDGLATLEQKENTGEVGTYTYPSSDAAFDAACEALKGLI